MVPRRRLGLTMLSILLAALAFLVCARWLPIRKRKHPPRIPATTPADTVALRSLQERIQAAIRRVMEAAVAVEGPQPAAATSGAFRSHYCSGVIITPEGLILSQFHVSHQLSGKPDPSGPPAWSERSRRPGERTTVVLHDGRELHAELLGANQTFDLSLLRLVESGPYPYAPLDPSATVALGDWVLKLGHPIGYRQGRPPVVRLGRVLFRHSDVFITDCLTVGGDSGGPFFDLNGHLVGIIGQGAIPAKYFVSLSSRGTGPAADPTNRLIQQHFDAMLRREIAPLDERASEGFLAGYLGVEDDEILPREHWTQGAAVAKAFQAVIRDARPSAVSIVDERGRNVVLGTVVRADGWIATIASMLPDQPKCQLSDAWIVDAQVVGMDPAFDLALLKIPVTGLPAVRWAEKAPLATGTILAAAGTPANPLGIGVVSVTRRDLPGPFPTHVRRPTIRPQPLWVQGRSTAEGYVVDICSENAGFLRGDILLSVAGREIHSKKDAHDCVDGHQVGEQVPVRLIRDGKRLDLTLELVAEPLTNSKAYADFPTLFEHDIPLPLGQCGGPLVDLSGKAVGMTMYRGTYGCMAIPGDCIERLLPELMKPGRLGDRWIKPPAATANNRRPAGQDQTAPAGR